jgi:hypothetical protein
VYTKIKFGIELKKFLQRTKDPYEIGKWAFSTYWEHLTDLEHGVRAIALTLNTMEDGPEFVFTHEELNKIADDLISGKDVQI